MAPGMQTTVNLLDGGWWTKEPERRLTGTLASGEPIDNVFYISYDAKIVLVGGPGDGTGTVEAGINIEPDALNLNSKDKWITCYIHLPGGYDIGEIRVSSILLEETLGVQHSNVQDGALMEHHLKVVTPSG